MANVWQQLVYIQYIHKYIVHLCGRACILRSVATVLVCGVVRGKEERCGFGCVLGQSMGDREMLLQWRPDLYTLS